MGKSTIKEKNTEDPKQYSSKNKEAVISKETIHEILKKQFLTMSMEQIKKWSEEEAKTTYKLDQSEIEIIESIISKSGRRYTGIDSFIREAIDLLALFWTNPGPELNNRIKKMWKNLPDETRKYVSENSPSFSKLMESSDPDHSIDEISKNTFYEFKQKLEIVRQYAKNPKSITFDYDPFGVNSISYDPHIVPNYPNYLVIGNDYDRIFPAKLVLILLADKIIQSKKKNETIWIDYTEFRENVFEDVRKISYFLKKKETEIFEKLSGNIKKKTRKITVGLPYLDPTVDNFSQIREKSAKNEFLDKYVGSTIRAWKKTIKIHPQDSQWSKKEEIGYLGGILMALGLVVVRQTNFNKDNLDITLSPAGLDFLKLKNPILDDENFERTISENECSFYLNHLVNHYKLEKAIIQLIQVGKNYEVIDAEHRYSNDDEHYLDANSVRRMIIEETLKISFEKCNNLEKEFMSKKIKDFNKPDIENLRNTEAESSSDYPFVARYPNDSQRWLEGYRSSLMGRMSEIGVVRWEIVDNKSRYYRNHLAHKDNKK